jgi:hypothetical protein
MMFKRKETDTTHEACFQSFVCFVVSFAVEELCLIDDAELSAEGRDV